MRNCMHELSHSAALSSRVVPANQTEESEVRELSGKVRDAMGRWKKGGKPHE